MTKQEWIGLGAVMVVVGGVLAYQYWPRDTAPETLASDDIAEVEDQNDDADSVQYPLPESASGVQALPVLADSDESMRQTLKDVFVASPIEALLVPKRIIQNIVATVNSLDGQIVPQRLRPLHHVPKLPVVKIVGGQMSLDPSNAKRYERYMAVLQALDAQTAAAAYLRYYPLFQEAYRELGFPDRYFNDRLIAVIDHLLEAPEVTAPIHLQQPKVFYLYEDDALEELSSGQKILIRIGPQNAQLVKAKLREFRAAVVKLVPANAPIHSE